jgi:NAD(P)-dependent dehydrogenase (short-subunit alcohol dehydrogenase family)
MSTWFITGASRGFGRELASAALRDGHSVIATARDPKRITPRGEALLALPLDVTDQEQADAAVKAGLERFGSIDVVVNNAGYGLFGSIEEISDAQARDVFDTNFFGLLTVVRAVLPALRAQRSGHIINMSSSAGFAVSAGRGLYGASKFAVEGVSEALRDELSPLGIKVTVVEPGSFRTNFLSTESRTVAQVGISDYSDTVGKLLTGIETNSGKQPGNPALAVEAILQVVTERNPPFRLPLGSDAVSLVEHKLSDVSDELQRWRDLSLSTDFSTS